jgi:DNA-binding beta-propeller fold protein YncE
VGKDAVLRALLAACLLGAVPATDASAAFGGLEQKPSIAGCISDTGAGPCADGTAVATPSAVTVSPDGRSAYVASTSINAIAVFDRAASGALTQKGCVSETGAGPCADGAALGQPLSVAVSPDGRSAYVASSASDAVAVFDRAADGTLTQKPGLAGCVSATGAPPCAGATGLDGARAVTVSPDGRNVYVASDVSDAVAVFDRAADGALTQKLGLAGCVSDSGAGGCVDVTGLDGASSVAVSPDGGSAYVASVSGAVAVFDRAANGTLTQKPALAGCISETAAGPCTDGRGLEGPFTLALSPDGRNVYVASNAGDAVAVFDRAAGGGLTQKPGPAGCISETGAGGCADGTGLDGASSVAVSPDGRSVYAASNASAAVAVLDRAADGTLAQQPGLAGCVSDTGAGPCVDGTALAGAAAVAVSPEARSVYVASGAADAVAVFDREQAATLPPPLPPPPVVAQSQPLPLACSGRIIVLLDVHRAGRRIEVSGLARTTYRGRRASIRALVRGSRAVTATIQADGSFRTTLPLPARRHRASVRYQATIEGRRSATLRLVRQLTIVGRRTTGAGTRITAQLAHARRRQRITISQQLTCTTSRRVRTVRTSRAGRFTVLLAPPRLPGQIAYYRATTQRTRGRTYSLPIAVRAAG